jgi:hypothetical protein
MEDQILFIRHDNLEVTFGWDLKNSARTNIKADILAVWKDCISSFEQDQREPRPVVGRNAMFRQPPGKK